MKFKLFTICFLTFMSFNLFAQINISTDFREFYIWEKKSKEWEKYDEDKNYLSFFEFNKDLTMFIHTTPSYITAYVINSSEFNNEEDHYEFDIMSDIGNKYFMILDIENNNLRFIMESDDDLILVRYNVKKIWTKD